MIALYKIFFSPFASGAGWAGFGAHLLHEWVILINLLLLLLGFALLAKHFEDSHVPNALPRFLPDDWKGCFALLAIVFVLSSFLDNIAAALIGGAMAHTVFRGKVHIGYLAAIVAASNAGGAGSVIGDTTTTMMWIAGISPLEVAEACYRRWRRARGIRYSGFASAAALCTDPAAFGFERCDRLAAGRRSGIHLDRRGRGQHHDQYAL